MTGRRPDHTNVFDNNKCFRDIGHDNNGKGANWVTFPGHFKNSNWTTLGGGTFSPSYRSWLLSPSKFREDISPKASSELGRFKVVGL
jgi:hypothetical protein